MTMSMHRTLVALQLPDSVPALIVVARAIVSGLAVGSTCSFRYRPVTKMGAADWSEPVSTVIR